MAEPKSFDDVHFEIPEDAPESAKFHMRAQMLVQAAFYALGDPSEKPGTYTVSAKEMLQLMSAAMAMLLSTDENLRTRSELRKAAEHLTKGIREMAQVMQEDATVHQMMMRLGLSSSRPN